MSNANVLVDDAELETTGSPKTRNRYNITPEQFVLAWQSSSTPQEVADKLTTIAGQTVPKSVIQTRATNYRGKGINLKKMGKTLAPLNVESLNSLINSES